LDDAIDFRINGLFETKPVTGQVYQGSNNQYVANITFYWSEYELGLENENGGFAVYPNPASDFLYLHGRQELPESAEIFSITGKKIMHVNYPQKISVSHLAPGIYLIKIKSSHYTWTGKFQKL